MSWFEMDVAWPCVRVRFNGLPKSDEDFERFPHAMNELYGRKEIFTMMFDTRNLGRIPLAYGRRLAKWVDDNADSARAYLKRSAIVVRSIFVRAFLKFMFLIRKPVSPHKVVRDIKEAILYLGWKNMMQNSLQKKTPTTKI